MSFFSALCGLLFEIIMIIPLYLLSLLAGKFKKPVTAGFGPEPMLNNVYHKRALEKCGISAETFVFDCYYITDEFDISLTSWKNLPPFIRKLKPYYLFLNSIFRYSCLFISFKGGALYNRPVLCHFEPFFYKAAKVRTVILPYGSDVQVMCRSRNLFFRHVNALDYPLFRKKIYYTRSCVDRWTVHADYIIAGCEWVDYMYAWDRLVLGHFSIDTDEWKPDFSHKSGKTLKILHAPNHRNIKGTAALEKAVQSLHDKGYCLELEVVSGVPNSVIREKMQQCDIVADQFTIGIFAMFAIEGMALEKPVLCYLRPDLIDLYLKSGVIEKDEFPIINTDITELEEKLIFLHDHRELLAEIGRKGREFVLKHYSLKAGAKLLTDAMKL